MGWIDVSARCELDFDSLFSHTTSAQTPIGRLLSAVLCGLQPSGADSKSHWKGCKCNEGKMQKLSRGGGSRVPVAIISVWSTLVKTFEEDLKR